MLENYRNASQITEYCNKFFIMNMRPINTPGKGVHEIKDEDEFNSEMIAQLLDSQRAGLAAILVSNDAEARYLFDKFSDYDQKFHDMTGEDFSIHRTRWNVICVDDAKGLEFSSVMVLSGRMTKNEKYIAFTRALDDLYIYSEVIDIAGYEKKPRSKKEEDIQEEVSEKLPEDVNVVTSMFEKSINPKHEYEKPKIKHVDSDVKKFFEDKGLEVLDNREHGGRLWIIGDKKAIRDIVNEAINKFGISGKYAFGRESHFKKGWCTKTDK